MSLIDLCPSASHRAALRLTGVAVGGPVSESLLRDLDQTDPVKLAEIANVNFIHTLLSAAQGQSSLLDAALPEDLWLYFREMENANIERLANCEDQLRRIGVAFAAEGLMGVIMKGGVQVLEPTGFDVKHRFLNDLDILFPIEDAPRAHACLAALGGTFEPYPAEFDNWSHHLPALHFSDPDNVVEIHVAVGAPFTASVMTAEDFIARARPSSVSGLMLPHPEDRFLHHILHCSYGRHEFHHVFLRNILDHVAFRKVTTAVDQNAARIRLDRAGLSAELRILSALTDLALGTEDSPAVKEESKWLKTALPLFGRPVQRRFRAVLETTSRILFQLITSSTHRRRILRVVRTKGIRDSLLSHHNRIFKNR